ncbi:MAG: HAD hydrolase family protein, partial [Candidatus Bathyarchaeota archaeon]
GAIMPSFIVSTSYEQYIRVLCNFLEFPFENAYCTRLDLDRYKLTEKEEERLRQLRKEMSALPTLEIPRNAQVVTDFSTQHQKTLEKLNEIFWKDISSMKIGEIFSEVNPIGGYEKAEAVQDITSRAQSDLSDVMYVGDSITDVSAFRLIREVGGLAISFNGNEYAIREAEIAALSENAVVTAILADSFNRLGKDGVFQLLDDWSHEALRTYGVSSSLRKRVSELYPELLPQVEAITPDNRERLMKESGAFRKTVRGEAIGTLG